MKRNLFVLYFIVLINFCFSQEKHIQSSDFIKCELVNRKKVYSKIKSLKNLSFAYSYSAVMTELDTIVDEKIRKRTDLLTVATVKYEFPSIEILNDTLNQKIDFYSMMKLFWNTQPNRHGKVNSKTARRSITKLSSKLTNKNQMFILSVFYEETNSTIFNLYIYDPYKLELLYYDRVNTKCDIRDETSLVKSIYYLLIKLKETTNG